jgi:uncharacterized protein
VSGAPQRPRGGAAARPGLVTIGPRTTVHALLADYPLLREELLGWDPAFAPLADAGRVKTWSRVTRLNDVAVSMDVPWRRLVNEVRRRIKEAYGEAPPAAGARTLPADGDYRLAELRAITGELEAGGSLLELAGRLRGLTAGLSEADADALDRALTKDAALARGAAEAHVMRAAEERRPGSLPVGHPLEVQRRAGRQLRRLVADLGAELERMGGSPSRRRWASAKPMVERLVGRISEVDAMFGRHRRAWFPALAVHGVDGLGSLVGGREEEALELLRRLRRAVAKDDAAFVAEAGGRLLEIVDDVLNTIDVIVAPLAERHLSEQDWRAVRELEDAVGYAFVAPPAWPPAPV